MKQSGIPAQDGFFWPGEFVPQQRIWLAWPERPDNWRKAAGPVQLAFKAVIEAILPVVDVSVMVTSAMYDSARKMLPDQVEVVKQPFNDAWMRDIGPTALVNQQGDVRAVSWQFNAWGGKQFGLYPDWRADDRVAAAVSDWMGIDYYQASFVLEGGAIHTDGEGTVYTTEECLLHPGRNPHLDKSQIEQLLLDYLGARKVIWLPLGVFNDETAGHVDNLLHVIAPAEVVLNWCEDVDDPQYERSGMALEVLLKEKDAKGRSIKVHKLPMPGPLYLSGEEAAGIEVCDTMKRVAGERLAGSYTNFLMVNGLVVMPLLDKRTDQRALSKLAGLLPDYRIVGIPAREILLGGGNIHCITQQIPCFPTTDP